MYLTSGLTALRRLSPDDLRAFQAYRTDPAVALYQSWDDMTDDRALGFLGQMAEVTPLFQPSHWTQIGVADASSDVLIGDMGIHLSAHQTEVELGITLAAHAHGQGHGLRATQLACAYIFDQTRAAQIKVWADMRNAPSRALAKRAGFTFTGIEVNDGVTEAAFALQRPKA